ncbi:MAG: hypothetical protein R3E09_09445 [Novosphingobium sp.]|nr:hypothetical protein [Novosphingobium sp.]
MEISVTYPSPVYVNGFSCRNCSEVALAEKFIDPANPQAGPFGVNDPKKAGKEYFAPEARNEELMRELHREQPRGVSHVASAYGAVQTTDSTPFVNLHV